MKKLFLVVAFGLTLSGACFTVYAHGADFDIRAAYASLGTEEPTLLPDSPFYFLKTIGRGIKRVFTFNEVKKAELELRFNDDRLAEITKLLIEKPEKDTALERALKNYLEAKERLKNRLENLKDKNKNVDSLLEKLAEKTLKHQKLFDELGDEFKKEDKEKVTRALAENLKEGLKLDAEKVNKTLKDKTTELNNPKLLEELKDKDAELKKSVEDFEKNIEAKTKEACGPKPLGLPIKCSDVVCKKGKWEFICEANAPIFGDIPKCGQYPTEPDYWVCRDGKWQRNENKAKESDTRKCFIGGCNGELCLSEDQKGLASICLYKEEYTCFKQAECKVQPNGKCEWTQTEELTQCLEKKRAECSPPVDCAAPPSNCRYEGGNTCGCGKLVCETPPTPVPEVKNLELEADDYGFYPQNTISVEKGTKVKITFNVRATRVYYGGLDFRSTKFNTEQIKPASSTTVEFIADESFTVTSYWPLSGVPKANLEIEVK